MKLKKKLVLIIGLLLAVYSLAMFFLGTFLIEWHLGSPSLKMKFLIATELFAASVLFLTAALAILARIASKITQPITVLAEATRGIAAGKYEEVTLPEEGKSLDEIATLTRSFKEMVKGLQEREKIRAVLNKVVSKEVADEIMKTTLHLGGEERVVTMLFSDVRGFTKMTESLPPQDTIGFLNAYMTKMSQIIEGEGGVIDKFVGDEIMALYSAPVVVPDHALRAISTAMLMMETLKKWNEERVLGGRQPIEMGIGIHTGLVVAGNMGAEDRLNYTVIGANVNLAARLCTAAGKGQIIISEHTLNEPHIRDSFFVEQKSPVVLKGFSEPVNIYQVMGFKWQ